MFIYGLYSGQLVLYIGKTMQSLKARESNHRTIANRASSRHIPPYIDWEIRLIEECQDAQGTLREQYWFDTLKPLYNRCRPGQTDQEYQQTEAGKESVRRYQQTEAFKESQRRYDQSEARKEYKRRYQQSEARKESKRRYYQKKKAKLNLTDKENEPRGVSE